MKTQILSKKLCTLILTLNCIYLNVFPQTCPPDFEIYGNESFCSCPFTPFSCPYNYCIGDYDPAYTYTVQLTPSGASYGHTNWLTGQPGCFELIWYQSSIPVAITVTATHSTGCSTTSTIYANQCCGAPSGSLFYSDARASQLPITAFTNSTIYIA